ncbi:MAG: ATP-dependent helicase [Candidatus Sericytochromatia bacterium]
MQAPAAPLKMMHDQAQILANYRGGRCAVLAAPGSGKTTLISHLVAEMIQKRGISPRRILVLTFTESAAAEFEQRTLALLQGRMAQPSFSTLHAFCNKILRQLHSAFSQREVLSDERKYALLEEVLLQRQLSHSQLDYVRLVADILMPRYRQRPFAHPLNSPEDVGDRTGIPSEHAPLLFQLPEIITDYENRLSMGQFIDYDMMISETHRLLIEHPTALQHIRERYHWIIEDEAQDSNLLQTAILELISGENGNLLRVGDPNQSIYGFNGADYRRLTLFAESYSAYPMGQSNRSAQPVIDLANAFHRLYPQAFPSAVEIQPGVKNPPPGWIWIKNYPSLAAETEALIQACRSLLSQDQSMAILCRTNQSCLWLEQTLRAAQLPTRLHHEKSPHFFKTPLVHLLRDLFAYLLEPWDYPRFQQLMSGWGFPRQGLRKLFPDNITPSDLEALSQQWLYSPDFSSDEYLRLCNCAGQLLFLIQHQHYPVSWQLAWIAENMLSSSDQQFQLRLLHQLWLKTHWNSGSQSPEAFWAWLEKAGMRKIRQLMAPEEPEENLKAPGVVHLLTVHRAKGLEWDAVLLPLFQYGQPFTAQDQELRTLLAALQQGLPYQSVMDQISEEEERESIRLVYVALTRARRHLLLSCSRERLPEAGLYQAPDSPLFHSLRNWYTMQKAEKRA